MYYLPPFFHITHTTDLYRYLEQPRLESLSISFEKCNWADHFELQKLALRLGSLRSTSKQLVIQCPSVAGGTIRFQKPLEVIEYANRMNFFSVLQKAYGEDLTIQFGAQSINARSEVHLQNELLLALQPKRWDSYHSKTYVPMHAVSDQLSVEAMTKWFETGSQIQELVEYYSDLDFVTSGEFATLVVHELLQNIVDHAWSSRGEKGSAAVSLCTVELGDRKAAEGRYQNRLRYAPPYEREFLSTLQGPGYLELCVSDTGVGVQTTLAECSNSFAEWFPHNREPREAELLAAAFWAPVTRDPGPHRPGHRGLYYVAESVREYDGVLVCQSGEHELSIVASDPTWRSKYLKRNPLAFTAESDVTRLEPPVYGTHYRILLPLVVPRRRRRYWDLKLSPIRDFTLPTNSPITLPTIVSAPTAPMPHEIEGDPRTAMILFRQRCREALSTGILGGKPLEGWVWLSCSNIRAWRKQHFHILLEEIKASSIRVICLVNVPSPIFQPFVLVARHVTSTDDEKLIVLLDEKGRRGLICRSYDPMHVNFMRWGVERSPFQPDSSAAGKLLASVVDEFVSAFPNLTFADYQFLMAGAGIEVEFSPMLESYRATTVAEISPKCFVTDYIEFDEALRDPHLFRAIASYVHLIRNYLLRDAGFVAVRRAATRVMQFQAPADDLNLWSMSTPDPKHAPQADWLLGRPHICVLTDVVCRGGTVQQLLSDLALEPSSQPSPRVVCISPLQVRLVDQEGHIVPSRIVRTSIPGISELTLSSGLRVPIFSIIHATAHCSEEGDPNASKPEPTSNILFQPRVSEFAPPRVGEMGASDFIRLAERERALWLGHVSITEEHFDLEFNMLRLLKEGSVVLAQFCSQIADRIVELQVDAIVFPDESRIHFALSALEEALMSREKGLPRTIRLRRDESGNLFVRPSDISELRSARSVLLLDDAINSGGTAHQMLSRALELVPSDAHLHLQVLISRQSHHEEQLLQEVAAVRTAAFSYSAFVRIPVPFYSAISCPSCRARSDVTALVAGLGNNSHVAPVLEDLANRLAPRYVYDGAPPVTEIEPSLLYSIPILGETSIRSQQFITLSGAKAALSCAIGANRGEVSALLDIITDKSPLEFSLSSFLANTLFSRGDLPSSLLQAEITQRFWTKTCELVGKAASDLAVDRLLVGRSARELCLACWCAPARIQCRMFADLIRLSQHILIDTEFYGWLIFLAFIIRQTTVRDIEAQSEITAALSRIRVQLIGVRQRKPAGLGTVESLMRIRQVMQAFSGVPITEPWLDGVIDLLELLSYKAGHTRRFYLTETDVSWAESLFNRLRSQLELQAMGDVDAPQDVDPELWSELEIFLDQSHYYLGVIARSLTASLGGWFRAVQHAKPSSIDIPSVMNVARVCEKLAIDLDQLLDQALIAYRIRHADLLLLHLSKIVILQRELHEGLYKKSVEGAFAFRTEVENQLCHIFDLAPRYNPSALKEQHRIKSGRNIVFEGTMFEYFENVQNGNEEVRSCVLLSPRKLVDDILGDVLIDNLTKHVLSNVNKAARVVVRGEIEGIGSADHRVLIDVSILVDGKVWPLPKNMLTRTLGKNKDTILRLYGGNIHIEDQNTRSHLIIGVLSGHF